MTLEEEATLRALEGAFNPEFSEHRRKICLEQASCEHEWFYESPGRLCINTCKKCNLSVFY